MQNPTAMSTFNINATITVPGVRNSGEAINEIRVMLGDYEDSNPEHGKHISIQINGTDEAEIKTPGGE